MLQTWFKLFFRNQQKNWLNSLINISGLALGLLGLILTLLYFNYEKLYDQWNPYKDEVYKVGHRMLGDGQIFSSTTQPEGPKSAEVIPEIEDYLVIRSHYGKDLFSTNGKSHFSTKIIYSDANFFKFFPFEVLEGNSTDFLNDFNSVVISEKLKKQLFDDEVVLGKTLKKGDKNYIITGVYRLKKPSSILPEAIVKRTINKNYNTSWGAFMHYTFYKVKSPKSISKITKQIHQLFIDNYYVKEAQEYGISLEECISRFGTAPFLEKLNGLRLHTKADSSILEGKGNYQFLMILLGLSTLIIIISSINFINLSTASASQRAKEVGIKKTLGLGGNQLKVQFLLEILLQFLIAFFIALLLAEIVLPYYNTYLKTTINFTAKLVLQVFVVTFVLALIIGSLYALYVSNFKTINVLKGNFSRSRNMLFGRNIMLGVQFIISGFFLIGGLVVKYQVDFMNAKTLGFSGEQIVVVNFSDFRNKYKKFNKAKSILQNNSNITKISAGYESPGMDEDFSLDFDYEDKTVDVKFIPIADNYFEILDIPLVSGRSFSDKFPSDKKNGILFNETAIKKLQIKDPIGKTIKAFDEDFTIIGVVKDYHYDGFDKDIRPIFYTHLGARDWLNSMANSVIFKLKPNDISVTIQEIEAVWRTEIEPKYPFSFHFVNEKFKKTYEKFEQQQMLFTLLTTLIIIIALLGLFALATLTIQQRLKEVAIRKTLGASVQEIMFQLLKNFLKIVLISSIILTPIAYYFMQNWLENFVYRINMPIVPYIVTPIILIVLVFAVVGLKAYNATKVDLIKYLKFE